MKLLSSFLAASLVLALGGTAVAQRPGAVRPGLKPDVPPILRKMVQASRTLRYSGTRTVEFKRGPDRDSHVEYVVRDGARTRIEFPGSSPVSGQIIVENERERQHYFPDVNEIHIMASRREEIASRLIGMMRDLGGRAEVRVTDGDKVAGMPTSLVTIGEREGNVLQKLWVHQRTGLLLKRELFDSVGSRVGFFEFSEVNLNPDIQPSDFRILRKNAKMLTPLDLVRRFSRQSGFEPLTIRSESEVQLDEVRVIRLAQEPVLVQTYKSPIGPLTLFQTKGDVDRRAFERMARIEKFNSWVWTQGGKTLALIGNQSETELKRLSRLVDLPETKQ